MTAVATDPSAGASPRRRALPLIVGLILAVAGGAGGYLGVRGGLLGAAAEPAGPESAEAAHAPLPDAAFVPLPSLVVNLPEEGERRFLRFTGQLEVAPEHAEDVAALVPRVMDVLNGYLRAVDLHEVEEPASLLRLRSQMLRRAQVVAGGDRVRGLLVMEFVVN